MLNILIGCLSKLLIPFFLILGLSCPYVSAKTLFVATTGTNSGTCTNQSSPCRTISYGISQMSGGDGRVFDLFRRWMYRYDLYSRAVPPFNDEQVERDLFTGIDEEPNTTRT